MTENKLGKVDLVLWTKNGASTLMPVLKRINRVIPSNVINQKFIVDDNSSDNTVAIAKACSWKSLSNEGTGICDGANTALKHVETSFFCSFEQDVLLANNWWSNVSKVMQQNGDIGCVQGLRFSTLPVWRILEEYQFEKNPAAFVSIDNNLFRTKVVRSLGGFPCGSAICTDTKLRNLMLEKTNFKWVLLSNVASSHIRNSSAYAVHHACSQHMICSDHTSASLFVMIKMFLFSPFRGAEIACRKKCLAVCWYYPYLRWELLKAERRETL